MTKQISSPQHAADSDPAATAKPPRLSLGLWESVRLPGGDLGVLVVFPETFACALEAQAEQLGLPLSDYLRGWVQRAADYNWL